MKLNIIPCENGVENIHMLRKTLKNKGDIENYEIRYRGTPTEFHNSLKFYKCL